MTTATKLPRPISEDYRVVERSGAFPVVSARDCEQPGCDRRAGWLVLGRRTRALCTRDASRRIRRRALPKGRWAR
jgi:hypothetical protein